MKKLGLIGFPLSHSFSAKYFSDKFKAEGVKDYEYIPYPLKDLKEIPKLLQQQPGLVGLNVTIPYKEKIIPYLDEVKDIAKRIGAVNVIKIVNDQLIGYNSDYYGFKNSLIPLIQVRNSSSLKALVLGTGGASKAIRCVLDDLQIEYKLVSRGDQGDLNYEQLKKDSKWYSSHKLIINCTPLGTYPNIDLKPELDYTALTKDNILYDLVYNPAETAFMLEGNKKGAIVKNGYDMLKEQAEVSWEIWQS